MADYNPRLKKPVAGLTLAALGVVYGDIGTSPLYAAKETFNPDHGIPLNTSNEIVGDLLGANDRRVAQVRDPHHAGQQQRRRRHHGAAGARVISGEGSPALGCADHDARRVRRVIVLW